MHSLTGTIFVTNAGDAEGKAHEAARSYFGDREYRLGISVHERRDMAQRVLHYEVDYTAEQCVPGH